MVELGGKNEERLFLQDLTFKHKGKDIVVKKTDMPMIISVIHRHISRYYLAGFFCKQGRKVLDFPCGSGYGYTVLGNNMIYEGMDNSVYTIEYAKRVYNNSLKVFMHGDLENPNLKQNAYTVIACIEGLEHIWSKYQQPLMAHFNNALKPEGYLVITTPEAKEKSGQSADNPYHKYELTYNDFRNLLEENFSDVLIIQKPEVLHNGKEYNMMFGICRKKGRGNNGSSL